MTGTGARLGRRPTVEAFHARLRRSRSEAGKAQCLRIQALHLQQTGDPERIAAAVELLDELVAKYPDRTQIAQAHVQRAECLDALDRASEAIVSFRAGIAAQREFPGVRTRVALVFGMFCLRRDLVELLDEVAGYVNELADESPFPRDVFEANAVLAIAHAHRGDAKAARAYAEGAIAAAKQRTSGFARHAGLGLVEHVDPRLVSKLRALLR